MQGTWDEAQMRVEKLAREQVEKHWEWPPRRLMARQAARGMGRGTSGFESGKAAS